MPQTMFHGKVTDYPGLNSRRSPEPGYVGIQCEAHYGISHLSDVIYVPERDAEDYIARERFYGRNALRM